MKTLIITLALCLLAASAQAQPRLYAPDGKYLGQLSANEFAPDSTSNRFGRYGSEFSPDSINNPFGVYGSPFSPLSPNNPYAVGSSPPPRSSTGAGSWNAQD